MKQHTSLKDCNYDLGTLFEGHKRLQLTEKWRQDLTETQPAILVFYFLEINTIICMKLIHKEPNRSELSVLIILLLFIQEGL